MWFRSRLEELRYVSQVSDDSGTIDRSNKTRALVLWLSNIFKKTLSIVYPRYRQSTTQSHPEFSSKRLNVKNCSIDTREVETLPLDARASPRGGPLVVRVTDQERFEGSAEVVEREPKPESRVSFLYFARESPIEVSTHRYYLHVLFFFPSLGPFEKKRRKKIPQASIRRRLAQSSSRRLVSYRASPPPTTRSIVCPQPSPDKPVSTHPLHHNVE